MTPTPPLSAAGLRRSLTSPRAFAEILTGAPLWPWQSDVAQSDARYRCILAGRRAGKSRLLAVLALWTAFTKPGASVVIVSVGEVASLRVLADVAALCRSPLLAGSVVDELKSVVTLTNGSRIESYPASMRQIRGVGADLLIIDEAAFVPRDIWSAAYPSVADRVRAGARVVLASTPWPVADSWFREWHQRGLDGDPNVASWWCPSSANPNIGTAELADMRSGMSAEEYEREIEARWTSEQGAYLTADEIDGAVADYPLLPPEAVSARMPWDPWIRRREQSWAAAGGVDWGFARDAQAVALVSALDDGGMNGDGLVYFVPWIEQAFGCPYAKWVDRLHQAASAYGLVVLASEVNGVGAAPTETLRGRLAALGTTVIPVWTDSRRKQAGFGKLKLLLQGGRLVLPREPELLRQLRGLAFERTDAGSVRIGVPERAGHDDLAMALMQAVSCVRPFERVADEIPVREQLPHTVTGAGVRVPLDARPAQWHTASFTAPAGRERSTENAW
jgi:hypothetical protein